MERTEGSDVCEQVYAESEPSCVRGRSGKIGLFLIPAFERGHERRTHVEKLCCLWCLLFEAVAWSLYEKYEYSQAARTVVSFFHLLWALRSQSGDWLNSNSSSEIVPSYNSLKLHKTKPLHRHQSEQDLLVSLPLHGLVPLHTWSMGRLGPSCAVHGHCVCIYPAKSRAWLWRLFIVSRESQKQLHEKSVVSVWLKAETDCLKCKVI